MTPTQSSGNNNEAKERKKRETRKLLEESSHPLADAIISIGDDVNGLKESIAKLFIIVAGDAVHDIDGLVQKNIKSKEANKDIISRVTALETQVKIMKAFGTAIAVSMGVISNWILEVIKSFFGKH